MEEYRGFTEGFERLEQAMARLAEAQARTETALQELDRQCENVVADIEDIAYIVLYDVLKREFDWEVGVLERIWQQWSLGLMH
jgi:enamine deaminase RidA (YjgF/YER057c/UK114 family)